jgi:hypothetical protein
LNRVDNWIFIDNSDNPYQIIAEASFANVEITNIEIWGNLKVHYGK